MELLPAIDLKDGKCVRLKQGDMATQTVFGEHPATQAFEFAAQGAKWLHLVDLDGAFAGEPVNAGAVEEILRSVKIKTELGGGIRSLETVERWLSNGVSRVILGTVALRNPDFVVRACREFPHRIAVGIDAKNGFVAVEGWAETSDMRDVDLAKKFQNAGVEAIIYTDVSKDGLLKGPNLDATAALAKSVDIPVIVSGGVSSLDDIRACKSRSLSTPNLAGVIAGRALYDKRFTVAQALAVLGENE